MNIQKIMVVGGGGQMGCGIAQVAAQAGFDTAIVDVDQAALDRGLHRIDRSLQRLVRAGTLDDAGAEQARGFLSTSTDLEAAAAGTDHVIESIVEDVEAKRSLFRALDGICAEHVIFASNTSQFAISRLASATERPDRVIGTHWFNPPPVMRLIEIVRGVETSDATVEQTLELARRFGKETVVCKRDTQGFLTSRLALLFSIEAARLVDEGIADVEDINKACVLAFNHAMGPLDTLDLGGLDTALRAAEAMTEHYGERFRAPQSLRALVNAGHLGRKSGRGFREYGEAQ
jgi:3-hydroxybutyryl-CoA dehydrogenase